MTMDTFSVVLILISGFLMAIVGVLSGLYSNYLFPEETPVGWYSMAVSLVLLGSVLGIRPFLSTLTEKWLWMFALMLGALGLLSGFWSSSKKGVEI